MYLIVERETGEILWELPSKENALKLCYNGVFRYQRKAI